MYLKCALFAMLTLLGSGSANLIKSRQSSITPINDLTIYRPASNYSGPGVLYARSIQLPDFSLLATWENYSPEPPVVYYPIYRSTDFGRTWTEYSRVRDTYRNMGARFQPTMYVLPAALGQYPAGTILLAGNILPLDGASTHIDIYASVDNGRTWSFASSVATGGKADIANGATPVWEPFLLMHQRKLTVYYADQRDPAHGQKTCHQITTDGKNWGPVVNDAADPVYNRRPGMPVVVQLANGKWMMTYEIVNAPEGNAPGYYLLADDPWSFLAKPAIPIVASNGARPQSSPFIVVTSTGRIIVSGGQSGDLFINDANAAQNAWRVVSTRQPSGYSRSMNLITQPGSSKQWMSIISAGWFNSQPTNRVSFGIVDPAAL